MLYSCGEMVVSPLIALTSGAACCYETHIRAALSLRYAFIIYLFSFSPCDNFRIVFGGKYQRRFLLPSFSALFYTSANDLFPLTLIFALASF